MSLTLALSLRTASGEAIAVEPSAWMAAAAYFVLIGLGVLVDLGLALRWRERLPSWPAMTARLLARPWDIADAGLVGGGLVLLVGFGSVTVSLAHRLWGCSEQVAIVAQSVAFHWAALGLVWLLLRWRGRSWREAFGGSGRRWGAVFALGLVAYLAAMPLIWFYSVWYQALLHAVGIDPTLQDVAAALTDRQPWAMRLYLTVLGVAVAPLAEELVFRGVLLPAVARLTGVVPAVLIVSALFAGVHMHVPTLVPLFGIGVALSLAYLYTGSLVTAVVMHGVFNAVNLALLTALRNG